MHFGTGIVKTAEDFGSQGAWPSHPALLDWLAVEFVKSGWDVKAMHRRILLSSTYRQSSKSTALMRTQDPDNRLLARGPRFRLPAEMIRDHALAISGLLVERIGGESVKPYQPPGLWDDVVYANVPRFKQDHGEKLYRRSLYTYWKRSVPPPNLQAFDAPSPCCTKQVVGGTMRSGVAVATSRSSSSSGRTPARASARRPASIAMSDVA